MTSQKRNRRNRTIVSSSSSEASAQGSNLSAERLDNAAELIAIGEMQFSDCIDLVERAQLLPLVAHRRRVRLVKFLARLIAQDIARSREP